ncbi:MAG: gliding motility-associated C-terminal domain-containing protein [Phaeodactylibacter sp.]|nr:gliding motility-associated C-terminal domain-containing protein [Phaeodactylibacter sp.]MCB9273909.1 gliding motility-associated C-terminal domain-containing protein [Lewinellaceae bacterium]
MLRTLLFLLALHFAVSLPAQFILNGDAVVLNDSCYRLTEALNGRAGSIWNPAKINLNQSFEVVMDIFLGCEDALGADGIVFGFQPISTSIGQGGGGIGFLGITPSLGIEFDTWQNTTLSDPYYDHLAISRDGDLNHLGAGNLAGPVQASPTSINVEDCSFHSLRVSWDAVRQLLSVYFDCSLRLTYSGDIVNDIFHGDPFVYWGFTSATGGANNLHQVCFSYTTFQDKLPDVVLCPGGQVHLQARGGIQYTWAPPQGLSNPNIPNPVASPAQTTNYVVEVRDACGIPFYDSVRVEVAGDSVFFNLGAPDTAICEGQALLLDVTSSSATYQWSNGAQTPAITVGEGFYSVTVTKTDTFCIADDQINISTIPIPHLNLGPDTALCEGQTVLLRSDFTDGALRWQDGSTADSLRATRTGLYELIASNECGTATDAVRVDIESCREAYFPNAFSPNNDGRNDRFYIQDGGDVARITLMRIFGRWGNLVFEARDLLPNDPAQGWDGRFNGEPMPSGIYVYYAEIVFRDGVAERRQGEVVLVR